jgi:glycerophosphoryl diester phosphodiesterase
MRSSPSDPDPLDPGRIGFTHRGLHGPRVPENSLAAFDAALKLRAGIECDVRLSGDGEVMIVHDHDLERLCGSDQIVEMTAAEAIAGRRLLGTDHHIPWLTELLDLVVGRVPLLIELKTCKGNAAKLAEAVARDLADYSGPVGVMSFDPKVSWWFARHVPYQRRGLVVSGRASQFDRWTAIGYGRPHFLAVDRTLLGSKWAAKMRTKRPLYSWTIATAEQRAQAQVHADALIWEADG